MRVLLGLLKGGLVGAAVGFGAWKAGIAGGPAAYLVYGVVGLLVGIVCGRAIWRQETLVTPALKGVFGFLVGMGLYWVVGKTIGGLRLPFTAQLGLPDHPLAGLPMLLAPVVGIVYGVFVEVDDGERKGAAAAAAPEAKK
jgi:hypothetical protein